MLLSPRPSPGFTTASDPISRNSPLAKAASRRREVSEFPAECQSDRGQRANRSELPDRALAPPRANGDGWCYASPQYPSVGGARRPHGPRRGRGRAHAGPRAMHGQREHHRHSAGQTPNVLEAAQSGRQPLAASAPAGIHNRPSASCHHPMPKSVAPSPTLHVRLIRAFHKFLQGRGGLLLGAAVHAPPVSRRSHHATALLTAATTSWPNHLNISHLDDNGNIANVSL